MTTATAPDRSLQQRRAALEIGNDIRIRRARMKEAIKAGDLTASEVIMRPPYYAESMKVIDLIRAIPWVGVGKSQAIVQQARIAAVKTVGGLSSRQRTELVSTLARWERR